LRFGFHLSIGGGLTAVVDHAVDLGCETAQIFSRNPRGWKAKPLAEDDAMLAVRAARAGIEPLVVHMPYLPNLATPDPAMYQRSVEALVEEIERCRFLGVPCLVTHLGKRKDSSIDAGIERVVTALNRAVKETPGESGNVMLLLENTAGQGSEVGASLEEIAEIMAGVEHCERVGFCFDTAHAFEAGMPIHTQKGLDETLVKLDTLVGIENLRVIHLNDSRTPFGSRVDRHWHIGEGEMGMEAFGRIVAHDALQGLPAIMETPGDEEWDRRNLFTVLRLREEAAYSLDTTG